MCKKFKICPWWAPLAIFYQVRLGSQTQKICCSILNIQKKPVCIKNGLFTLQNRIQHLKNGQVPIFMKFHEETF